MIVLVVVLVLVSVGLAVALRREVARRVEVEESREQVRTELAAAVEARRSAEAETAATARLRDDALERAARARHEATEVSRLLQSERDVRASVEAALDETETALADATASLDELRADIADLPTAASGADDVEERWQLALAGVARTWEISVSPSPGLPSPLDDSADLLRAAIGIEVDAAREEAGSVIELEWTDDGVAPVAVAVRALAVAQELIARLAKTAEEAVLEVTSTPTAVRLRVSATDEDGAPIDLDVAPELAIGPGDYRVGSVAPEDTEASG